MYHGDSPIFYIYKFRGVLKIIPAKVKVGNSVSKGGVAHPLIKRAHPSFKVTSNRTSQYTNTSFNISCKFSSCFRYIKIFVCEKTIAPFKFTDFVYLLDHIYKYDQYFDIFLTDQYNLHATHFFNSHQIHLSHDVN